MKQFPTKELGPDGTPKARSLEALSLVVTLSLMTRIIGGALFGILSDKYGRRWPFIGNCVLLIVFVLATGFSQTYGQFIAVRTLFGVGKSSWSCVN